MTQLAERFGFDLADALARDREALAHFFERVLAAVLQAEADGYLYCVPPGTSRAVQPIPKQPPECPIKPSKRVGLT